MGSGRVPVGRGWARTRFALACSALLLSGAALAQPATGKPADETAPAVQAPPTEGARASTPSDTAGSNSPPRVSPPHGSPPPSASESPTASQPPAGGLELAPAAPSAEPGSPAPSAASPGATPPTATPPAALLPHDLSPWGMFIHSDVIVQTVMLGLAFASLVTWTIWFAKGLELAGARRRAARATRLLADAESLEGAAQAIGAGGTRRGPVAALVAAALRERVRSPVQDLDGIKERVAIALSRVEARAGRAMARGTGLLATIGSTAPFVGLFGTVWGIMNAFVGISQTRTTNLAVVAPGIAEALLATAAGLVAAIPAVIIYNVFARAIAGYRALLSDAAGEVLQHLSRDLAGGTQAPSATRAAPRDALAPAAE